MFKIFFKISIYAYQKNPASTFELCTFYQISVSINSISKKPSKQETKQLLFMITPKTIASIYPKVLIIDRLLKNPLTQMR